MTDIAEHVPEIAKNADGHIHPVYGRCAVCRQLVKWDDVGQFPGRWVHFRDDDAHYAGYREGEKWGRDQGKRDGERDGRHEMKAAAIEQLRETGHDDAAALLEAMVLGRPGCGEPHSTFSSDCAKCYDVDYDPYGW